MNTFQRNAIVAVAASGLFLVSTQGVSAQQPPSPHAPEVPREQTTPRVAESKAGDTVKVRGELLRVDAEAKTLTVKGTDGKETRFSYDDSTTIVGGGEGTAGLATMSGATVTVHYDKDDTHANHDAPAMTQTTPRAEASAKAHKATKIEIAPRS